MTQWKLPVTLYPFAMAAVAINLFLLFLLLQAVGIKAMAPVDAVLWAIPLGIPATWAATRWVRHLLDIAEGRKKA